MSFAVCFAAAGQTPPVELPAPPDPPRVMLDQSLASRVLRVVSIRPDAVVFREASGRLVTIPSDRVLAIVPDRAGAATGVSESERTPVRLQLVDGQILPGVLPPRERADDEHVLWQSTILGELRVPLEQVSSVLLRPETRGWRPFRAGVSDSVLLVNGDSVSGFVAELGARVVVERDKNISEIPTTRVVAIAMANPAKPPQGVWAWFFDGTVVAASTLSVDNDGKLTLIPAIPGLSPVERSLSELRAVLFDAARVTGLASLPLTHSPGDDRRWSPAPSVPDARDAALFAPDLEIPGPMQVDWELPAGASRLAATAELPQSCRVWGDLEVIISLDGRELSRTRLHSAQPSADLNLDFGSPGKPGARLRLTVEPGPTGPIQDRVVLRRPLLLIAK